MLTDTDAIRETGLDALALKPSECQISTASALPVDFVTVDFEGQANLPDADLLESLAANITIRVTVAIRADGFDPLGDDHLYDRIPSNAEYVLVAGHPAYLTDREQAKPIATRLRTALDRLSNAWVGSEGIERLALATGAPQFDLLTPTTQQDIKALRTLGFTEEIAIYAPTVPSENTDVILEAVGEYVARRSAVRRALPEQAPTDSRATGQAREVLLAGASDYALVGNTDSIAQQIVDLKDAGADYVVGYPAQGLQAFIEQR